MNLIIYCFYSKILLYEGMHMNNKAFTLVELVGVVAVLALIFLVTYPNIVSLSKKEDNKQYDLMVKDLCLAGETYIYENNIPC